MRITSSKEVERLIAKGLISKDKVATVKKAVKTAKKTPTNNIEDKLYQLLLPVYGDFFEDKDGQLVKELKVFPDRKYRLDLALVRYRINIDIDGISAHATFYNPHTGQNVPNIEGFKRDRTRDMLLISKGWLVIRCMKYHVDNEPQLILDAVASLVKKQKLLPVDISREHGKHPVLNA